MRAIKLMALAAILALTGAACSTDDGGAVNSPTPTEPTSGAVAVTGTTDNTWDPAEVSISVGDTVDWSWTGAAGGHNVVGIEDTAMNSGDAVETGTYSYTFAEAGTFTYYCTIHGTADGNGMVGTVTVA